MNQLKFQSSMNGQISKCMRPWIQSLFIGAVGVFFLLVSTLAAYADNHVYNIYIVGDASCADCTRLTTALTQFEYLRNGGMELSQSGFKLNYTDSDHTAEATIHIRYLDKQQMSDHAAVVAMPRGARLPYLAWFKDGQQEYAHAGLEGDTSSAIIRWFTSFTRDTYLLPRPAGREFSRPTPLSVSHIEALFDERTHRLLSLPATQMSAVALLGAAHSPTSNYYLNSLRLSDFKNFLMGAGQIPSDAIITLAGSREGSFQNADTSLTVGGVITRTTMSSLNSSGSFTKANLRSLVQSLSSVPNRNLLMIATGPENIAGLSTWTGSENDRSTLTPADLRVATSHGRFRSTVLFAGNSHGGAFAEAVSCGFFAAHPGFSAIHFAEPLVNSENVQSAAVASDYLKQIDTKMRTGEFTFRELHEYAFLNTDMRDVPYSSYDYLVDQFFNEPNASDTAQMPEYMSAGQLNELLQSNVGTFETDFLYDQMRVPSNVLHKILDKSPILTRLKKTSHLFRIDQFRLAGSRDETASLRIHFPAGIKLWQYPSAKGVMYLTHLDLDNLERIIAQFYGEQNSDAFSAQCNQRAFFDGSVLDTLPNQGANRSDVTQYSCFLFEGRKSVGVIHLSTTDSWHKNYAHYSANALVEQQWASAYLKRSILARAQMMVRRHYLNRHMIRLSEQTSASRLLRRWRSLQACENQTLNQFLRNGISSPNQGGHSGESGNNASSVGGM